MLRQPHGGAPIATVDCALGRKSVIFVPLQSIQCFGHCLLTRNGEERNRKQWLVVSHGAGLVLRCRVLKARRLIRFMESRSSVTIETISEKAPTTPPPLYPSEKTLMARVWGSCSWAKYVHFTAAGADLQTLMQRGESRFAFSVPSVGLSVSGPRANTMQLGSGSTLCRCWRRTKSMCNDGDK